MASRGYTTPDYLPYPNNPADPADLPPENRALAEATQTGLIARVPNTRRIVAGDGLLASPAENLAQDLTLSVRVAAPLRIVNDQVGIDTTYGYSPVAHGHPEYSPVGHGHRFSEVGISKGEVYVGTLTAGQEKQFDVARTPGDTPLVTVQHHSTYIFATADIISDGVFRINVRNSTSSTTHTNVKVSWLLVVA